jgi:hypothetical protein
MKDTVEITLKMSVKDLNQTLALLHLDVITNDDERKEYDGNTLNVSDIANNEMEFKVAIGAVFLAAKEESKKQ